MKLYNWDETIKKGGIYKYVGKSWESSQILVVIKFPTLQAYTINNGTVRKVDHTGSCMDNTWVKCPKCWQKLDNNRKVKA